MPETSQNQRIVSLKAVDEQLFKSFYDLNFRGSDLSHNQVFIGEDLSHRLEKDIGDKITIYSPLDQSIGLGIPYKKEFIIAGVFKTKILDYAIVQEHELLKKVTLQQIQDNINFLTAKCMYDTHWQDCVNFNRALDKTRGQSFLDTTPEFKQYV